MDFIISLTGFLIFFVIRITLLSFEVISRAPCAAKYSNFSALEGNSLSALSPVCPN